MVRLTLLYLFALLSQAFAADWVLEIAPEHVNVPFSVITVGGKEPMYASLRNTSKRPLQLWKDWCSWGYFNLKFRVIREDGKAFELSRTVGSWTRNFPDPCVVEPGEVCEWKTLDETFYGFPPDWKNGEKVKLIAIYTWEFDALDRRYSKQDDEKNAKADAAMLENLKSTNPDAAVAYQKSLANRKTRTELLSAAWTGSVESEAYEVALYHGAK